MIVRREKISDLEKITAVLEQAFSGPDEGRIVENLRKRGELTLALYCEVDGRPAGYVGYSPIKSDKGRVVGVGLAPVAVIPALQNQGIGSQLIYYGNEQIMQMGFWAIFALGAPEFYSRFGFQLARDFNFYSKFDPSGDHFMFTGRLPRQTNKVMLHFSEVFDLVAAAGDPA